MNRFAAPNLLGRLGPVSLLILAALASPAEAQECGRWLYTPGQGVPGVVSGATSYVSWDPDGSGPAKELMVAAGSYLRFAGDVPCSGLAAWDGDRWMAMTPPVAGFTSVIANYRGDLVALGQHPIASGGTAPVAAWDGTAWLPVGDGITNATGSYPSELGVAGDTIFISGQFHIEGDPDVVRVASWDGERWSRIGSPNYAIPFNMTVVGGRLFATLGGWLSEWRDSAWHPMIPTSSARVMAAYGDDLIIAGRFEEIMGVVYNNIGRWDGLELWPMSGGLTSTATKPVESVFEHDGELIVSGVFSEAGGLPIRNIAIWDGSEWSPHRARLGETNLTLLLRYDGELIYRINASSIDIYTEAGLVSWDGERWRPLGYGLNNRIVAFGHYNDQVVAAGLFVTAGSGPAPHVAMWDGIDWHPLADGTDRDVYGLAEFQGSLYAAGEFQVAGGEPVGYIARWDGSAWHDVGGGVAAPEYAYTPAYIRELHVINDELVAGGYFVSAGDVPADSSAAWDGQTWRSLGDGPGAGVRDFTTYDGELVTVGSFGSYGPIKLEGRARFDGAAWHSIGAGAPSHLGLYVSQAHEGRLIVGGDHYWLGNLVHK